MSSQPGNPQYDSPQPGDPEYGDAHGADDRYADGHDMDEPTGPPYRAIAMVLLAAVVLAVGVGLVQLFGGDDEATPTADDTTSQVEQDGQAGQGAHGQADPDGAAGPGADGQAGADGAEGPDGAPAEGADGTDPRPGDPAASAPGEPAGPAPGAAVPDVTSVPVQIYNNSTVTGLAGRTGEALRENGYAVGEVANMPSNRGVVARSTAFYGSGPGEQQAAEAIASQLGITAEPRPADLASEAPGVIVIVTQDLDR